MILSVHAHGDLIPWTAARRGSGDAWGIGQYKYVPRLECWYPDRIPLELVSAVYIVGVTAPPRPDSTETPAQMTWDEMWGGGGPQRSGQRSERS